MWSLITDVCREMGVRTDIPYRDLTEKEKDIVYHGLAEACQMTLKDLVKWVAGVPDSLPEEMRSKADGSLLWDPRSRLQKKKQHYREIYTHEISSFYAKHESEAVIVQDTVMGCNDQNKCTESIISR